MTWASGAPTIHVVTRGTVDPQSAVISELLRGAFEASRMTEGRDGRDLDDTVDLPANLHHFLESLE